MRERLGEGVRVPCIAASLLSWQHRRSHLASRNNGEGGREERPAEHAGASPTSPTAVDVPASSANSYHGDVRMTSFACATRNRQKDVLRFDFLTTQHPILGACLV